MAKPRGHSKSPLDQKQKALADEAEKLRLEMERLQRMIEDAPRLAAAEEKRRREELVARARSASHRPAPRGALADRRYDLHTGASAYRAPRRALKSERREARLKFFGLCILLAALLIFLFSRF